MTQLMLPCLVRMESPLFLHHRTKLRLLSGADGFVIVPTQIGSSFELMMNFVSLYPNTLFSTMNLGTSNKASMTTLYYRFPKSQHPLDVLASTMTMRQACDSHIPT